LRRTGRATHKTVTLSGLHEHESSTSQAQSKKFVAENQRSA